MDTVCSHYLNLKNPLKTEKKYTKILQTVFGKKNKGCIYLGESIFETHP